MTSGIFACAVTRGKASPECINDSTRANRFPSFPPGCKLAKSSSLKPRRSLNVTASASPNASIVVVEAVGANPSAQASCAIEQSNATSAAPANVENLERTFLSAAFDFSSGAPFLARPLREKWGLSLPDLTEETAPPFAPFEGWGSVQISSPVIAINGTRNLLIVASSARISSVSPDADKASTTSPRTTIPKSPCSASTGCRYSAGVPVELNVAAILRAINPLLPIPVTTTRPAQENNNSTAR